MASIAVFGKICLVTIIPNIYMNFIGPAKGLVLDMNLKGKHQNIYFLSGCLDNYPTPYPKIGILLDHV